MNRITDTIMPHKTIIRLSGVARNPANDFPARPLGCSSYLIASRESREAAVIDPHRDIQQYQDLAAERGYKIVAVIDTHLHADHVSGNRDLAAATGAQVYLHEDADAVFPFTPLKDGSAISLGQVDLQVVHTPGHRPESISLLVVNPARSPEPSMVLSGDSLFVGDIGRPDFGGPEGASQQFESIKRLLALEDYVEVFPAHFEGTCGKGMCGRPSSTIGFERRFNPALQLSEEEFLEYAATPPSNPLNMAAIMAANRGEASFTWPEISHDDTVPDVEPDDAAAWLRERDALVIDVRDPWEYAEGRIPGAVSLPQSDLAVRLEELPKDRDLLVVCASGNRSMRSAGFLKAVDFPRVTNLAGGTSGWIAAGNPLETRTETPILSKLPFS